MRFRKLRMIVAVSLVIFIILVANIIAFGFLKEKLYVSQDTKKDSGLVLTLRDDSSIVNTNTNGGGAQQSNTVAIPPTPAPTSPPVTTHTTRRTRAS